MGRMNIEKKILSRTEQNLRKRRSLLDFAPDMVYNGIAYSVKRFAQRTSFSREVFGKVHASRCCHIMMANRRQYHILDERYLPSSNL